MRNNPYVPFSSKILEVIPHTEKEYTFRMEFEGEVKPGQFFEVSIPKFGEAPISVSGISPKSIDLTIRRVGRVTDEVFENYAGDTLFLRGPYGNGFDVNKYTDSECLVVAGGTGVSPVRGVIDALSESKDAKDKHIILGFKSPSDMLFREDIARWEKSIDLILTMDKEAEGYSGNVGLVTKFIPEVKLNNVETTQAVVVGPPPMMKFSVIELLKRGFKEENIWVSYERKMCCGIGKCGHCKVNDTYICLDGPVFNYVDSKSLID